MKIFRYLPLAVTTLGLAASAAHAQTISLGNLTNSYSQTETLSNLTSTVTLDTNVYYNSVNNLYTYQYDIINNTDVDGLSAFTLPVSNAADYGTTGVAFFFAGAPAAGSVTVADDNALGTSVGEGNTNINVGTFNAIYNTKPSVGGQYVSAYTGPSGSLVFQGTGESIPENSDSATAFGDYYYVQSVSAPGNVSHINISDDYSADFTGPGPQAAAVPEASSFSLLGLGTLGLLGLLFARKARRPII